MKLNGLLDKIRYNILKDMGFEIMVVSSSNYNRSNKNEQITENCVKFLTC